MTYVAGIRDGRPWADLLEVVGADPAGFILAEMSGWVVSSPVGLGQELVRKGATVLRHAHTMCCDLTADAVTEWKGVTMRPGFRAVPCDRDADALLPAWRAAFPRSHPDHFAGSDEQALDGRLRPLLSGRLVGPLLTCSRLALDTADQVVAGVVLTHRDGLPWIAEAFRAPGNSCSGLGRELLCSALADAAARGHASAELAVSVPNPARKVYESLGFRISDTSLTIVVP